MEPDVARIMHERPLWTRFDYLEADANEVAAFPSLHAALPLVVGLFCLLRTPNLRWLGWVGVGQALVTGAFMVYLGEHWVFDILGGYALAGVIAGLFGSGLAFRALDAARLGGFARSCNELVFPAPGAVATEPEPAALPRAA
jgi:membrane-associated phospholipid phosphatase